MTKDLTEYDLVVVSTSAGKDSQAMLDHLVEMADAQGFPRDRMIAIHADLGRMEWPGTKELAEEQAKHYGLRFMVTKRDEDLLDQIERRYEEFQARADRLEQYAETGSGLTDKDWKWLAKKTKNQDLTVEMIKTLADKDRNTVAWPRATVRFCTSDHKRDQNAKTQTRLAQEYLLGLAEADRSNPVWPSNKARYCTSDHKRDQIGKAYTRMVNEAAKKHGPVKILECLGFRAEESPARAKRNVFETNKRVSNGRKTVDTWLPIHEWSTEEVWARIKQSGVRHHNAYDLGMPRLSCVFCIFAPEAALKIAGRHNRDLLDEYVRVEDKVGKTFRQDLAIRTVRDQIEAGDTTESVDAEAASDWNM